MSNHVQRLEHYYNALIGRTRPEVMPTFREAGRDLHRGVEQQFSFFGP